VKRLSIFDFRFLISNRRGALGICELFFVFCILQCVVALPAHAQTQPAAWMEGWRFRATVTIDQPAASGDVTIVHDGLAQPDGRDVRVIGPDGTLASLFIGFADAQRTRVVFDAAAGAGAYQVYLGNNATDLPAPPEGVWALGNPAWQPTGGYTCVSFDPQVTFDRANLTTIDAVLGMFEGGLKAAQAAIATEAAAQPDPTKRKQLIIETRVKSTAGNLFVPGVQNGWLHRVTLRFKVDQPGSYTIIMGDGRESDQLGVVLLDGDKNKAVVSGWYAANAIFGQVYGTIGTAELPAGAHTFDVYTIRRAPDVRIGPASGERPAAYLSGIDAHFDAAQRFSVDQFESTGGTPASAYLAAMKDNVTAGRFAAARRLARLASERFAGDPLLAEFSSSSELAEVESYERNWLTEGKNPGRTGYVAQPDFAPPLVLASSAQEVPAYDTRHESAAVWVEGRLIYGLPSELPGLPWGVTSGVSVGDNMLYVGTKDGQMHAVSLVSGSRVWSFPGGGSCPGTPLVYRGKLFYGSLDRRLYAIDLRDGRMAWNYPPRGWIQGSPAAADGRVFFGSRDGFAYAIDAELGVERWKLDLGAPLMSTPAVLDGRVYIGTTAGRFVCIDASNGTILWSFDAGAAIQGGSTVGAGRVAFGDASGKIHSLDTQTGKPLWPARDVGGPVVASPIAVGSTLWGGTQNGLLFGINASTGEVLWQEKAPDGGAITRPPLFCDGALVFTTSRREAPQPDGSWTHVGGATITFRKAPPAP